MALETTCPKCDSTSFEMTSKTNVKNCNHVISFIRCTECGCAITAFSERHEAILFQLGKQLGVR